MSTRHHELHFNSKPYHSFDLLHMFLEDTSNKQKTDMSNAPVCSPSFDPTKLLDDVIQIEDEGKFKEYFLKEKAKEANRVTLPVAPYSELMVNRELIEQTQELIIEREESVPAYSVPEQKYVKDGTARRSAQKILKMGEQLVQAKPLSIISLKSRICGWFQPGRAEVGLQGGSDQKKPKLQVSRF